MPRASGPRRDPVGRRRPSTLPLGRVKLTGSSPDDFQLEVTSPLPLGRVKLIGSSPDDFQLALTVPPPGPDDIQLTLTVPPGIGLLPIDYLVGLVIKTSIPAFSWE